MRSAIRCVAVALTLLAFAALALFVAGVWSYVTHGKFQQERLFAAVVLGALTLGLLFVRVVPWRPLELGLGAALASAMGVGVIATVAGTARGALIGALILVGVIVAPAAIGGVAGGLLRRAAARSEAREVGAPAHAQTMGPRPP